jgi:hypothetical protein
MISSILIFSLDKELRLIEILSSYSSTEIVFSKKRKKISKKLKILEA